ncbi:copper homeostasis protein CutC [Allosediminivita pacifica]|uniref:PF03932 family protein CutC n=1 Tax=Allosediminivita pacifica TaxID=1267769 RepID=A0A2T6BA45_9RHOB|nr:copper homeostasis protein CutC [Allosediminivita pacifica]PTX52961.1 copper homeostasis protein CutC [Allosediminivita pacifica]GGA94177.1 copper homeostasis protein [Allosediminivita pacifica]
MTRTLEICVDSAEGLKVAIAGGADRIELCSALALGGLTPSVGLMSHAARAPVPVLAMIRPRAGGFDWSRDEIAMMEAEIAAAAQAGLAGVVIGATRTTGTGTLLDAPTLERLAIAAGDMDITLHRCIDVVDDPLAALDLAADLGIRRVLSSGRATSAPEGTARLAEMMRHAASRLTVMPGAGINPVTLPCLLSALDPAEVHASASKPDPGPATLTHLGFHPEGARRTDAATVAELKRILSAQAG